MSRPYQPADLVASQRARFQAHIQAEEERRDLAKYPYRSNVTQATQTDPTDLRVRSQVLEKCRADLKSSGDRLSQ